MHHSAPGSKFTYSQGVPTSPTGYKAPRVSMFTIHLVTSILRGTRKARSTHPSLHTLSQAPSNLFQQGPSPFPFVKLVTYLSEKQHHNVISQEERDLGLMTGENFFKSQKNQSVGSCKQQVGNSGLGRRGLISPPAPQPHPT